jgi:glycerophosphoryl diester phosphodiesterase
MLPQLFARIILGIGLPAISISGSLAQELPKFIAHRGASHDAPENTMSAFRLAWQQGADGIEGDFFLSKDGQIVCIHDKDTKRTGSENLPVGKSTLAELRKLEYGSWKDPKFKGEPLPLLGEVLDELPKEKWFLLEIKDTDKIVQPIAEILHLKKADPTRVVLISFDANVIKKCREIMPEYRACLLHALNDFNKTGQADKYLEIIKSSGSQGLAYKEQESIPAEWLSKIAGKNQILASWTINTPESAARAVTRGVNFLITDRPGGLRGELEKRAKK